MNQTDFIAAKRLAGATIMETIKAVMNEYGLSLGAAKTAVSSHSAWATIVNAAQPLHNDLEDSKSNSSAKKI